MFACYLCETIKRFSIQITNLNSITMNLSKKAIAALTVVLCCIYACSTNEITSQKNSNSQDSTFWTISSLYSQFAATQNQTNENLTALNTAIQSFVSATEDSLRNNATETFLALERDSIERPAWKFELVINDTVFMANENWISVRLLTYIFTGGAHGITKFYAFNYDLKNQKMLSAEEIIDFNKTTAVNETLVANFKNTSDCFITDPSLELVSSINFNESGVCFSYEQYLLGPYSCGVAEVTVPQLDLSDALLIQL